MFARHALTLAITGVLASGCGNSETGQNAPADDAAPRPATTSTNTAAAAAAPPMTLPTGFTATLFADGLPTPRHIVVTDAGRVYVTLRSGQAKFVPSDEAGGVAGLEDSDGDGSADITRTFGRPLADTGLALRDDKLFYSTMTGVYAFPLGDQVLPAGPEESVVAEMPESGSGHRTKAITFDSEGHLYAQIGSPSNSCQAEPGVAGSAGLNPCTLLDEHGGVFRYLADARNQIHAEDGIRFSRGHRNIVALEWNDSANALFALMHGRDGLNQMWPDLFTAAQDIEIPAEEFHRIEQGDDLGWPYTYWDPIRSQRMVSPEYGGDGLTVAEDSRYRSPLLAFPAHWAPNDLVFYQGTQFPARYRHGAFIAFHGSVNPRRTDRGGYSVVFVPMNAAGEVTGDWEIFADDFERGAADGGIAGRPTGLAIGPDGDLFIVDDAGGRIWKVTYAAG